MSFFDSIRRLSAVALIAAVPFVAACADDDGATPVDQDTDTTGTITGTVSGPSGPIVGALVGTSPATATALTDANGAFTITNVPIPTNPTAYAVTASASGFTSASASVSLSSTNPTGNVTLTLAADTGPPVPTTGDLNVLVTNRNGTPQSGADVSVSDAAGAVVAMATTDANGFALFSGLDEGAYTVIAEATLSGIEFRASGGTNIRGGETSFLQLTLARDFGQSVFPNIDGESVTLDDEADIRFVPVPGGTDDDPLVDCNVIRTQHMFIAEVVQDGDDEDSPTVSGVKVQWDLNISSQFAPGPANNTGSIVDSDDPDLDPGTARSSLDPSFIVDTRTAVTFTNDNDQTISFNNQNVVVGPGQTWIIITSPVEGITDVIAATSDIPATDPDCANSDPDNCDKEIAIKRWVNWDTRVAELDWDGNGLDPNVAANPAASFDDVSDGGTLTNVLSRSEDDCGFVPPPVPNGGLVGAQNFLCELQDNRFLLYAEVSPLRTDSPFRAFHSGTIKLQITDDVPDIEFFDDALIPNVEQDGPSPNAGDNEGTDDDFTFDNVADNAEGEFDFLNDNDGADPQGTDPDTTGWVIFELRLDPAEFFCDDVNNDNVCDPGNGASPDTFSTAYQNLLNGTADNTNSFSLTFCDEFGEDCDRIDFDKEWVASRVQIIKNIPGATIQEVDEKDVKTHTIQVGQEFSYTVTVINDGEVPSENVRITDTLPRFGVQFEMPDDGIGVRDGAQAFAYVTDRPTFDPVAVVYAIDEDNDEDGDVINNCIRGDDGSTTGNAYVVPASCPAEDDVGSVAQARAAAESASTGDDGGDQIVWIQWFDPSILGRQQPGGGIETEDTVEVTLIADEEFVDIDPLDDNVDGYGDALPGVWCNIATATDGPGNLDDSPLTTESLTADTLCHEVREALLEVRKTTEDAVISGGAQASFDVEITNNGSAALTNTVIVDTLDQALFDATPDFSEMNITLGDSFPDATVTVNGRIFTVDIGTLQPTTDFILAYTVVVNTPGEDGVWCNRVTASGSTPAGTISDQDIACVTTTVTIELDVSNEDGFIDDGGVFQSGKEQFIVGEGAMDDDLSFVYRVEVVNQSAFDATGVTVVDEVAPNTAAIACREVLATAPAGEGGGDNPSVGTVSGGDCSASGFTWNIGTLGAGERATIFFRAEALAPQSGVGNRVRLTADQLTGEIVDEEPTTVTSN